MADAIFIHLEAYEAVGKPWCGSTTDVIVVTTRKNWAGSCPACVEHLRDLGMAGTTEQTTASG